VTDVLSFKTILLAIAGIAGLAGAIRIASVRRGGATG